MMKAGQDGNRQQPAVRLAGSFNAILNGENHEPDIRQHGGDQQNQHDPSVLYADHLFMSGIDFVGIHLQSFLDLTVSLFSVCYRNDITLI